MAADSGLNKIISGIFSPRHSSDGPVIQPVGGVICSDIRVLFFLSFKENLLRFGAKINNKIGHFAGLCLKKIVQTAKYDEDNISS